MAIKLIYATEDEIPEALKEHIAEAQVQIGDKKEFRQVVDVEDIEIHPKVSSLRNAYAREKEKRSKQKQLLDEQKEKLDLLPEDFTPEKWEELKELELNSGNLEEQKKKIKKELESQRQRVKEVLEQKHQKEKEELQKKLESRDAFIEKLVKQDRLREGLVEAGVAKELLAGAMALLGPRVKIKQEDDNFVAVVETDMGEFSAKDYAGQWVQIDEGKPYVKPAGGPSLKPSGRLSNTEKNPFMPGQIDLTAQTKLYQEDKVKAERMKEAAAAEVQKRAAGK